MLKSQSAAEFARRIIHDQEYHANKARIMQTIDDFYHLLDNRTKGAVDLYTKKQNCC